MVLNRVIRAERTNERYCAQLRTEGEGEGEVWGVQTPSPTETPKALQNHAKLNPIVKTVKNC